MITLTDTQTGAPHHCQESRVSIHAVTTERSANRVQLAHFKEVTCNQKLWSNLLQCVGWHQTLFSMCWNCRAEVTVKSPPRLSECWWDKVEMERQEKVSLLSESAHTVLDGAMTCNNQSGMLRRTTSLRRAVLNLTVQGPRVEPEELSHHTEILFTYVFLLFSEFVWNPLEKHWMLLHLLLLI